MVKNQKLIDRQNAIELVPITVALDHNRALWPFAREGLERFFVAPGDIPSTIQITSSRRLSEHGTVRYPILTTERLAA